MECCAVDGYIQYYINGPKKQKRNNIEEEEEEKGWESQVTKKFKKKQEAMILNPISGETYASIVKDIKEIKVNELELNIIGIQKTKNGGVKINIANKNKGDIKTFKEKVKEKMKDKASVVSNKNQATVIIKGIEETTKIEEVIESIKMIAGEGEVNVNMSERTNLYGYKIAFAALQQKQARVLLNQRFITIGWNKCKVDERIIATRCF